MSCAGLGSICGVSYVDSGRFVFVFGDSNRFTVFLVMGLGTFRNASLVGLGSFHSATCAGLGSVLCVSCVGLGSFRCASWVELE